MRQISYTLSYTYPAMFQYTGGSDICTIQMLNKIVFSEVEGQICPEKVDVLAQKMKERVSNSSYASFVSFKSFKSFHLSFILL